VSRVSDVSLTGVRHGRECVSCVRRVSYRCETRLLHQTCLTHVKETCLVHTAPVNDLTRPQ